MSWSSRNIAVTDECIPKIEKLWRDISENVMQKNTRCWSARYQRKCHTEEHAFLELSGRTVIDDKVKIRMTKTSINGVSNDNVRESVSSNGKVGRPHRWRHFRTPPLWGKSCHAKRDRVRRRQLSCRIVVEEKKNIFLCVTRKTLLLEGACWLIDTKIAFTELWLRYRSSLRHQKRRATSLHNRNVTHSAIVCVTQSNAKSYDDALARKSVQKNILTRSTMILSNSRIYKREWRPSLLFFKVVRAILMFHILNSSKLLLLSDTGTQTKIKHEAYFCTSSFLIWHRTADKWILQHYLTSYNGHDMLTLFGGAPDSRKFDNLEKRASS